MDFLAAGGADGGLPELILDIALALVLAGVLAIAFTRLRIPTVAAFLVAGVILGPVGTGLISNRENIDTIAQLGLILLLFLIGLEIDVRALLTKGRSVLVSGPLLYPLSGLFGFVIVKGLLLLGIGTGIVSGSDYGPLYIGLAVAASSTVLVVALYQQSFLLDTVSGRIALAMLVFEDIWSVIVLAIQPSFDDPSLGPIVATFVGIAVLAAIAWALARYVLPVGFRWIAKQPSTILVASLAWCFGIVLIGINLDTAIDSVFGLDPGIAVSAGVAALIAGSTIAAIPFSAEIVRQVSVVRDFFITLFFVGIGMTIPAPDGAGVLLAGLGVALLTVLTRFTIMLPLLYATGTDRRNATLTVARMAQISEFSLVVAYLGLQLGHIDPTLNSVIVFAFVITAIGTPFVFARAEAIEARVAPVLDRIGMKPPPPGSEHEEKAYDLALLGVHRTASSLLNDLAEEFPETLSRTTVVDFNVAIHPRIAELGAAVTYGDFTSPETLHHAGVDKARVVLCTIPDDVLSSASTVDAVRVAREVSPDAMIIATATTFPEVRRIYAAGADFVLLPRLDAARSALQAVQAALNGQLEDLRDDFDVTLDGQGRREVLD
ncbi:MAG: cation:proton antiporter [Jiangellales bacterium]